MASAYLIAHFAQSPGGLRLLEADIYSEWPISQMFYPGCPVQVLVCSSDGWGDFEKARAALVEAIHAVVTLAWARPLFPRAVRR